MAEKEFIDLEKNRVVVFNLYTALFCQPDEDLMKKHVLFDKLAECTEKVYKSGKDDIIKLKAALNKNSQEELLIEYSRLFIGPFKMVAPPYSSLYFGDKNVLISEETLWVIKTYHKAGLMYDMKLKNPPDHVAIETEFLYYLIFNELKELQKKNYKQAKKLWLIQKEFNDIHFSKWIPRFCDNIIKGAELEFYTQLGICFKSFILNSSIPEFPKEIKKSQKPTK